MPTVSVLLENKEIKKFEISQNKTIYDEIEDLGHTLPHGCLAGACGSCKILILKGAENLTPESAVEKNTLESIKENVQKSLGLDFFKDKNLRLSCRVKTTGDITITPFPF